MSAWYLVLHSLRHGPDGRRSAGKITEGSGLTPVSIRLEGRWRDGLAAGRRGGRAAGRPGSVKVLPVVFSSGAQRIVARKPSNPMAAESAKNAWARCERPLRASSTKSTTAATVTI